MYLNKLYNDTTNNNNTCKVTRSQQDRMAVENSQKIGIKVGNIAVERIGSLIGSMTGVGSMIGVVSRTGVGSRIVSMVWVVSMSLRLVVRVDGWKDRMDSANQVLGILTQPFQTTLNKIKLHKKCPSTIILGCKFKRFYLIIVPYTI